MTRSGYVIIVFFSVTGVAITSFATLPLRLVWNVSASAPLGLYNLDTPHHLQVGELVALMPEKPLADFMVERGYIGRDVPLLKRVMALQGQKVCRIGNAVIVDGIEIGTALKRDRLGLELPVWQGCHLITDGNIFLMNPSVRDSLDGRYFGPISARSVIGRATPVYTDENGHGHFVWRAATQ
jgi:conjugative transfer signal peptidase TraF